MASMKFKRACILLATSGDGSMINPYALIAVAQKKPDALYAMMRKKGYHWSVKYQAWKK